MEIQKKYIEIAGKKMAVIDEGSGEPIVFLHGNPTSSYLWRNIAPNFKETNRIIVPDLMGMGDSEKLDGIDNPSYNLMGHYDFLDQLLDKLEIGNNIHFVIEPYIRFEGLPGEQKTMFFYDNSGNALEFKSFKDMDMLFSTKI